jgi:hypothetical protein
VTKEQLSDERLAELLEEYSERAAQPNCGVKEDIDIAAALRELQERRAAPEPTPTSADPPEDWGHDDCGICEEVRKRNK